MGSLAGLMKTTRAKSLVLAPCRPYVLMDFQARRWGRIVEHCLESDLLKLLPTRFTDPSLGVSAVPLLTCRS